MSQKVIVVTGAGSGIGRAIAQALAIAGHTVYASMRSLKERNQERVEQLSRFAAEKKVALRALELDVLSEESIRAAFDQVLLETGRLDVVVNNAGMLMVGIAEAFTPAQMARILDTNAISWLRGTGQRCRSCAHRDKAFSSMSGVRLRASMNLSSVLMLAARRRARRWPKQ